MTEVQARPTLAGAGNTHRREPVSTALGRTAAQLAHGSADDLSSARSARPVANAPRTSPHRHRRAGVGNILRSMLRNAGRGVRGAPR